MLDQCFINDITLRSLNQLVALRQGQLLARFPHELIIACGTMVGVRWQAEALTAGCTVDTQCSGGQVCRDGVCACPGSIDVTKSCSSCVGLCAPPYTCNGGICSESH